MDLYHRILNLCGSSGIRPGRMCNDLGISRGMITDLKMGRKQSLSADTLAKIADYFGTSVDSLLRDPEAPAAALPEEENVMILARRRKTLTPEQLRQVMEMTRVLFGDDFWGEEEDADDR